MFLISETLTCHPERSLSIRFANGQAESKDPYELNSLVAEISYGAPVKRPRTTDFDPAIGVLRLRDCFAKRSSHSAQDDRQQNDSYASGTGGHPGKLSR